MFCILQGWLVDLVNRFGKLGGFQILLDRFTSGANLSVPVIAALIRPFGLCYEVLTPHVVHKFFMPIVVSAEPNFPKILETEDLWQNFVNALMVAYVSE